MLENRFASANCTLAVAFTANVVEAQGDGVFNEVWCVTLQQHRYHRTRAVGTPFPFILMSMSSLYQAAIVKSELRDACGELNLKMSRLVFIIFGIISSTTQD